MTDRIHPTALVDAHAVLAPDVIVGPYSIIEGPVVIGPGTVLHPRVHLMGPLVIGKRNVIHTNAVLGGWPQDRKYKGEPSTVVIGDDNIIREGVTIHRGTGANTQTTIGSRCYLMVNSHVGHNCVVSDDVTLVNGALLAGFVEVAPRAIVGGNCAMHQFCRVGRLAMISASSSHNVDIPPFCITLRTNTIVKLNFVGLRRNGVSRDHINALRRMFQHVFRTNRPLTATFHDLPADLETVPEVREFIDFCRLTKRGVARYIPWSAQKGMAGVDGEATE